MLKMGCSPLTSVYLHQTHALVVSVQAMSEPGGLEVSVGPVSGIKCLPFVQELGKVPFCPLRDLIVKHQKLREGENRQCQVHHQVGEPHAVWLGTAGPGLQSGMGCGPLSQGFGRTTTRRRASWKRRQLSGHRQSLPFSAPRAALEFTASKELCQWASQNQE